MDALETMQNILELPCLLNANLKYCLLNKDKVPLKIDGTRVQPNNIKDFVDFDALCIDNLSDYAGIGISIQASNICAIDVDHCFKSPFILESIDDRGKDILNRFNKIAYCEFSFSGTGLRILFKHNIIDSYKTIYYIKNTKFEVEYYQPSTTSYRYVTITGRPIYKNEIADCSDEVLFNFLNDYMIRPVRAPRVGKEESEEKSFELYMELVKYHYLTNAKFQDIWFSRAPGSGADESERDYYLISYMYEHITKNKETLRLLFEQSPFFKSKDYKHRNKWEYNDYRYLDCIYNSFI